MKVAVCTRKKHIEIQDWPLPELDAEKVLIRISICGVCGSDLAAWEGSGHKKYPYTPGHEFCGVIDKIGENVNSLSIGQRVVINPNLGCGQCRYCRRSKPNLCDFLKSRPIKSNGGFAEYSAIDCRMVHRLPDELSDELAVFIEPLSCAIYAAKSAEVRAKEKVAIFGGGLMGLLTGLALGEAGAEIIFVEPEPNRAKLIYELLGAKVYSPEQIQGCGLAGEVDVAIDCSGNINAIRQAVDILRKAGRLVMSGLVMDTKEVDIRLIEVTTKELQIKGVWLNPNTFDEAISMTVKYKKILGKLKTQELRLEDISEAFERALTTDVIKVLVRPGLFKILVN